jgi:hypothetical protein
MDSYADDGPNAHLIQQYATNGGLQNQQNLGIQPIVEMHPSME